MNQSLSSEQIEMFARSLRVVTIQQQYDLGSLTWEEAVELVSGPLSPGDERSIRDDSNLLVMNPEDKKRFAAAENQK